MNGNGFKFNFKTTDQSTSVKRSADYSIAFYHKSKGFDNNNSKGCTGYINNCSSFNNNMNYQLPYTFAKWSNNWSWSPIKAHQNSQSQTLYTPKDTAAATKVVYAIRDKIISNCAANKFGDSVNFDSTIKGLTK